MMPRPWTDEEDTLLRKLYAEGLSASMIAAQMPGKRSRNSIIGRQHRLRISDGCQPKQRKKRESGLPVKPSTNFKYASHLQAASSAHVRALRLLEAKMRYAETSKSVQDVGIEPLMIPLLELEPHHCRWPVNSPDNGEGFLFCGHQKCEGSSYCSHHHEISRSHAPVRRGWTPTRRVA